MDDTELKITPEVTSFTYHVLSHVRVEMGGEPPKRWQIQENVVTSGDPPEDFVRFSAVIPVAVVGDEHGNKKGLNGQLLIEALDIEDAFDQLPGLIDEKLPGMVQDVNNFIARSKIQLPGPALIKQLNKNGGRFPGGGFSLDGS